MMTTRQFFGTDGIRGRANQFPMTADTALKVGMAAGLEFVRGDHRHKVVIAKDTRLSGYMLEPALTAGFIAVGMDVILVGPLPTPAVAMLTRSMRADLGVMISASHNPFEDNGIKLFAPNGSKLSDEVEMRIEARMQSDMSALVADAAGLGRAKRIEDARGRYIEFVKQTFPRHLRLDGMKIVVDCAHGAAYQIAPIVLTELGAEVITLGDKPNGLNINDHCGSTYPEVICAEVLKQKASLGIALDGDADRVIICDENGRLIDGDQILAIISAYWNSQGRLKGGKVVATQMSNLALEKYIESEGLKLIRSAVGDRYVIEEMRNHNCNIGGEQSGHIIMRDYVTTGDGLVAALQVLAVMLEKKQPLSVCGRPFEPLPQILKNIPFSGRDPLDTPGVKTAIAETEALLGKRGRVFIRKSGTEPKIRVMLEGDNLAEIEREADRLCAVIQKESKAA